VSTVKKGVSPDNTPPGKKATKKELATSASSASSVLDSPQDKKLAASKPVIDGVEPVLPNDIDAELDIEVESEGSITIETLASDLADDSDDLDVDDLDDDFANDDFAEDLADEADEDLDLTEDLSEELGPGKFIREPEGNTGDDEDEIPRSW
jgi:hypothetical protein